jgi:hypothetical protein
MSKHMIFGVHLTDRMKNSTDVQHVFTKYGCNIKTRIGLHDVSDAFCSPSGIIVLEMTGEEKLCEEMAAKLRAIQGVEVQKMIFA